LLKHLETKYSVPPKSVIKSVKTLVVLMGGVFPQKDIELQAKFDRSTLVRFLAALRIKKSFPSKTIILLGGSYEDPHGKGAYYLKLLAKDLGYDVISIDSPLDTVSSAIALKKYFASSNQTSNTKFLLLTSAYHMPRAILLFKHYGLKPIPYPTNYDYKLCRPSLNLLKFLPNPFYLSLTNEAVHEYLGLAFYKLKFFLEKHF